ncbi:OLC1v1030971C1 [Oldenlandia corymbosa var. corymbosa]|uniref:OLC1v1030971C1 n=1 Tax=Oldenlandia corymbosa var. corymbosa TaxID=529605 RepID=A0AAV1CHZ0_OLDCO|nr:OLC1v1030971C1 [Oldenlandia corymbosa var. corymbosa]
MNNIGLTVPFIISCVLLSFLLYLGWKILNSVWFRPKKLENLLRAQGLAGKPYKFLFGDFKELVMMIEEAASKPINLSDDIVPRALPFLIDTINKYGKNCFMWLGPIPAVMILDPEHVREIFHKYTLYEKNRFHPLGDYLVKGLAATEGEIWRKHRRLINPAFHPEKLKHMLPAFRLCASDMLSKWDESILQNNGSCERDVWPDLHKFTSDAISRTAFGSNYEEGRNIFELQTEQAELVMKEVKSFYFPGSRFLPTKRMRRIKDIQRQLYAIIGGLIDKRMRAMKAGEPTNDDLLNILLKSNLKEIGTQQGDKSLGMSTEDVIEECKLFYLGGQETASSLLAWTLVLLSRHQEWQSRAREEVLRVFGRNDPNFEGLNHLKIVSYSIFHHLFGLERLFSVR